MFLTFTPFTFLFFLIYLIVLLFMLFVSDFLVFWIFIELLILLFIGIGFTIFVNSYSNLILYFVVQTVASFNILVFHLLTMPSLVCFSLFLNLAMFPFASWYISLLYSFPNFPLFLASTLHKLPPFLIILNFYSLAFQQLLAVSLVLTLLLAGVVALSTIDMRYLLIVSSVANNSWFVLATFTQSYYVFFMFYSFYFVSLFSCFTLFNNLSNFILAYNSSSVLIVSSLFLNLSALPPFPIFFFNLYLLYECFNISTLFIQFSLFFVILFNVFMMVSYIKILFKYYVNSFTVFSVYLN